MATRNNLEDEYKFNSLCNCEVCHKKIIRSYKKINDGLLQRKIKETKLIKWKKMGGLEISFIDLLKYLVPSAGNSKGAPIMVPEMLIFSKGQITNFYCFSKAHSELKRIKTPYNALKIIKVIINAQKQRYCPSKKNRVLPIVIMWLKDGYELLPESDFIKFMTRRPSTHQWNNIQYLQSYILDSHGSSCLVNYEYEAPSSGHTSDDFDINIDQHIGAPEEYPKRICTVLGYYLYRTHNIDLISIKATFMKDHLNNLWMSSAKDVYVRINSQFDKNQCNGFGITQSAEDSIKYILNEFKELKVENKVKVKQLSEVMDKNYKAMKMSTGITEEKLNLEDKLNLDRTFELVRPGIPFKLSEMLSPKFNPNDSIQKKISEGKEVLGATKKLAKIASPYEIMSAFMYIPIEQHRKIKVRTNILRKLSKQKDHDFNRTSIGLPNISLKRLELSEAATRYKNQDKNNYRIPKSTACNKSVLLK